MNREMIATFRPWRLLNILKAFPRHLKMYADVTSNQRSALTSCVQLLLNLFINLTCLFRGLYNIIKVRAVTLGVDTEHSFKTNHCR